MRKLTATLCLTLALFLGSEVRGSDLPVCVSPTDNRDIKSNWTNCIGTYILSNRTMNKYVGEFKNGQQNQYCSTEWFKISGRWKSGWKYGEHIYLFPDGEEFKIEYDENGYQIPYRRKPNLNIENPQNPLSAAEKENKETSAREHSVRK